jgi:glycogen operon protein
MKKSLMQPVTATWPGRPFPLGATWDGRGVNFALFSEHAEKVELCLFDDSGRREIQRIPISLIRDTGLTRISCCLTRTRVI